MTDLTGKQKRCLRRAGQAAPAVTVIGKAGLTEQVVAVLDEMLARQELVKIRLPVRDAAGRDALAAEVAQATGAALAGVVGHTALLYRPNGDLDTDKRIALPEA